MKIIFMGTPEFSVPTLETLINHHEHEIIAVFSQPPRPAGRGHKVQESPIQKLAEKNNIEVHCPISLKKVDQGMVSLMKSADVAVVVAYGLLLPSILLNAPKYGCLNIHASLLPKWRGAAPIQRAIEAGDDVTGVTIMQMDEGMDTGDMIAIKECPITEVDTAQLLHDRLSKLGAELIIDVLDQDGVWQKTVQPEEGLHAAKLSKEESRIDWSKTADKIGQKIRAFTPWPGTYFECEGEKIKIIEYQVIKEETKENAGVVVDDQLTIACGKYTLLRPTIIQRPGKKAAETKEVLRGFSIAKGTVL